MFHWSDKPCCHSYTDGTHGTINGISPQLDNKDGFRLWLLWAGRTNSIFMSGGWRADMKIKRKSGDHSPDQSIQCYELLTNTLIRVTVFSHWRLDYGVPGTRTQRQWLNSKLQWKCGGNKFHNELWTWQIKCWTLLNNRDLCDRWWHYAMSGAAPVGSQRNN